MGMKNTANKCFFCNSRVDLDCTDNSRLINQIELSIETGLELEMTEGKQLELELKTAD